MSAEQMQREDIEKDRNLADSMLQQANNLMTVDDAGMTYATMALTHALLALKGEVQRIGDILDDRMETL